MTPCCHAHDRNLGFHGRDCVDALYCYAENDDHTATCMEPNHHEGECVFADNEKIAIAKELNR